MSGTFDFLIDRIGVRPIWPVKVTIDTMLNFNDDFDGHGDCVTDLETKGYNGCQLCFTGHSVGRNR